MSAQDRRQFAGTGRQSPWTRQNPPRPCFGLRRAFQKDDSNINALIMFFDLARRLLQRLECPAQHAPSPWP
jgi:hypothetical protein